jgi:putative membrane protein
MKKLFRTYLIEAVVLYLVSQIASGLVFQQGIKSLLITAAALTIGSYLVKPIITVLILPLNLITFGLFRWVAHAIVLFLVDLVLEEFAVSGFVFGGFTSSWLDLPGLSLPAGPLAYIAFSFLLSAITSVIYWLVK